MKKTILSAMVLALMVFTTSCTKNKEKEETVKPQTEEVVDMHTSENSLDWAGTYEGVLPCADCEGIKTSITLQDDKTFEETSEYLGKKSNFKEKGTFEWDKTGSIVTLKYKDTQHSYKVAEGSIILLDQEGKEISGDLAKNYILNKVN